MGCSFECALSMMQTPKLKREAVGERVQGCGYLFAKRLLRNTSFHHSPRHNIAVINSLGGKTSRECEEAVRTADYAAFRDKDPLFPDSAVMIRELFSEQIDGASKVVRAELGTKSHQRLVAVQHRDNKIHEKGKNKDRYTQELASALDQVALQLNATVVFFAAGTAPRHDSFDFYEEISQQMTQPAIVYRAENLWKVVGLVSLADAVFSTSLHVRIMAFVHAKPRVTWCNKKWPLKHANFIRLWDTNSSAPCVVPDHLNQTWDTLQKHYLKDPEKSRTETIQLSQQIVQKYLESFHEFSGLLRPKE